MKAALVALQLLLVGSLQLTAAMASVSWRVQLWLGGGGVDAAVGVWVRGHMRVCGVVCAMEWVRHPRCVYPCQKGVQSILLGCIALQALLPSEFFLPRSSFV